MRRLKISAPLPVSFQCLLLASRQTNFFLLSLRQHPDLSCRGSPANFGLGLKKKYPALGQCENSPPVHPSTHVCLCKLRRLRFWRPQKRERKKEIFFVLAKQKNLKQIKVGFFNDLSLALCLSLFGFFLPCVSQPVLPRRINSD